MNKEMNERIKRLMVHHYLDDLKNLDIDLILLFFSAFSRFEFTLKASVRYCAKDRFNNAFANWNLFAKEIEEHFNPDKTSELREAFEYYINHPPRIQAFIDSNLIWQDNNKPDTKSNFEWVLSSIRVVRNNLFHGGKFPYDQVRDSDLLAHGLIILNECIELDKDLLHIFRASPVLA